MGCNLMFSLGAKFFQLFYTDTDRAMRSISKKSKKKKRIEDNSDMLKDRKICWNFANPRRRDFPLLSENRIQRLPVPTYLYNINVHIRSEKVCYLPAYHLYLKSAKHSHQHIHSTVLSHATRVQRPTLESMPRGTSVTLVQPRIFLIYYEYVPIAVIVCQG